ncbi:MAG: hypothetical protein F2934_02240 [Actinobacteria bacterium]|uniref:4a-hydroxytetrahydrobiopterin dehydratase n=1 Tax=freshwater metagenome TaxID=449393 RepID=A0A6J6SS14_9ZZZZ|nr:hypothetical protein [Actinomycetota bacterium]MSZ02951.1 hypothetical protein [Actinomycetota bacterium]MTB05933.1 hypothetical protein [Actinomycetota bacterium]
MRYTPVDASGFALLDGLDDWRYVLSGLRATFRFASFSAAAAFAAEVAQLADAADHHPDIDLRYPGTVRLVASTHAVNGVSTHDIDLARLVSGLAAQAGAVADADDNEE